MPGSARSWRRSVLGLVTAGGLAVTGVLAPAGPSSADTAPPVATTPATVSADPLPTVQIDGVVWAQVVIGTTVYAGGRFTTARPAGAAPGTSTVPRGNLLAYDIRTGKLVSSFAPDLNGQVLALAASPDGKTLYVAGEFTRANGATRQRIAAYSTVTGKVIGTFRPAMSSRVRALAVAGTTVYAGGDFTVAAGSARARLAAFRARDGARLSWAPAANGSVTALVVTPDATKVIAGGRFTTLSGKAAYGLGAVNARTGAVLPWAANAEVRNAGKDASITSLTTDGTKIYGTGYTFGPGGNLEGGFAAEPSTGKIVWIQDCHGDHYGGYARGGVFYTVGHAHHCGNVGGFPEVRPRQWHRALAFTTAATGTVKRNTVRPEAYKNWAGFPAPTLLTWFPRVAAGSFTGQTQGAWSVTGTKDYVVLGGEFPSVNGVPQQGLVRLAVRALAPNKVGPAVRGGDFVPTLTTPARGTVTATWTANWDQDNEALTYQLVRTDRAASPVHSRVARSSFWRRPRMAFTDQGLESGRTYTYRLVARDPLGNTVTGGQVSVTAR